MLNLSTAFDTVDHNILLQWLESIGIRGIVLSWFSSYISNHTQSVFLKGVLSEAVLIYAVVFHKGLYLVQSSLTSIANLLVRL